MTNQSSRTSRTFSRRYRLSDWQGKYHLEEQASKHIGMQSYYRRLPYTARLVRQLGHDPAYASPRDSGNGFIANYLIPLGSIIIITLISILVLFN